MFWIQLAAWIGLLAVGTGAFGAHGLERVATGEQIEWWKTAAHYQLSHALAMLGFGLLKERHPDSFTLAGWAFLVGCVVFCGTLYAMALGAPRWLGAVTPVGGLALMVGWGGLAFAALRVGKKQAG